MNHEPRPKNIPAQVAAVTDGAVRAGPLVGIPQLLRDLGRDPSAVFAAAGVDPHLLDNPENVVSFTVAGRLYDSCVDATDCPHFGLLLGQRNGFECLGLVGMLARHSQTLKHALRNIVMHLHLHDRGAVPSSYGGRRRSETRLHHLSARRDGDRADLRPQRGGRLQHLAYTLRPWLETPVRTPVAYQAPRSRSLPTCIRGDPVFDADRMALVFAADWLARPLPDADPALYRVLQGRISELTATSYGDLPSRVRRIVCNLLHCGNGSLESAADVLSMHPRTLNRRLQRLGTTYRQLRDECHRTIAYQLLRDTELPIAEIAVRLQYADTPAFTRAFHRWSGYTPAAWRAECQKA